MRLKGNRMILKQAEPLAQTKGGIWLPEKNVEPRNIGTIIAIGDTVDPNLLNKEVMFRLESSKDVDFGETQGKLIFVTDLIATLN